MLSFESMIYRLEELGLTDIILPFILIFTLIFGTLQKTNILGKERKNYNVVVALVIALSTIIPHVTHSYPPGADVVEIMNNALPNVGLMVVIVIMFFIVVGIWGGEPQWLGTSAAGWVAFVSLMIILYVFGNAAGWFNYWPNWIDEETRSLLIIILVFGIIIWFITKDDSKEKVRGIQKAAQGVAKLFGGK